MDFFGMSQRNDTPTKNVPPVFESQRMREKCVYQTLGLFVNIYVFPMWSGHCEPELYVCDRFVRQYLHVSLADGRVAKIPRLQRGQILTTLKSMLIWCRNLGMIYHYFLESIKTPQRPNFLASLKMMMTVGPNIPWRYYVCWYSSTVYCLWEMHARCFKPVLLIPKAIKIPMFQPTSRWNRL